MTCCTFNCWDTNKQKYGFMTFFKDERSQANPTSLSFEDTFYLMSIILVIAKEEDINNDNGTLIIYTLIYITYIFSPLYMTLSG